MTKRVAPSLVVVSGLPGVGKTAVARSVAARLDAVHLSVDPVEDAMLTCGLSSGWELGVAAYEVTRVNAEQNLSLGWSVVVDAVNENDAARQTWRSAATRRGASLHFVMLTCPDQGEHRRRLRSRQRGFRSLPEPTWAQARERASTYEPWSDNVLEVEAVGQVEAVAEVITTAIMC